MAFAIVAGIPDLRLASDRYLGLEADRAKAELLAGFESETDVLGLSQIYYERSADVRGRSPIFLSHIAAAERRGEALALLLPRTGRVLEVGCGTGGLLVAASRRGIDIEGTDLASRWLVVARRRLLDRGFQVPLTAADASRLPFADATFDTVVADSLVEHLENPTAAVQEWARVLRPGGRLVLWSPNRFSLATDPHVNLWGLGWLPRRIARFYVQLRRRNMWLISCLSPREASRIASAGGFVDVSVEPPRISADWSRAHGPWKRGLLSAYAGCLSTRLGRTIALEIGPLWQLQARLGSRHTPTKEAR